MTSPSPLMKLVHDAISSALRSAPPDAGMASLSDLAHVLVALAVATLPPERRLVLLVNNMPGAESDEERAVEEVRRTYAFARALASSRVLPS